MRFCDKQTLIIGVLLVGAALSQSSDSSEKECANPVQCVEHPCNVNSCPAYRDAVCKSACGSCSAIFYDASGKELTSADCNEIHCEGGMTFNKCGSACPRTCSDPSPTICTEQCVPRCECPTNTFLMNGRCVTKEQCTVPIEKSCRSNLVYNECGSACRRPWKHCGAADSGDETKGNGDETKGNGDETKGSGDETKGNGDGSGDEPSDSAPFSADQAAEACTTQCVPRCECPSDRPVLHQGTCIPEDACPKEDCPFTGCLLDPCMFAECPDHLDAVCKPSYCYAIEGQDQGQCAAEFFTTKDEVKIEACLAGQNCKGGMEFKVGSCGCLKTCGDPDRAECGLEKCVTRCQCPTDKPIWKDGQCVTVEECEPTEMCENNQVYLPGNKPRLCGEHAEVSSEQECENKDSCEAKCRCPDTLPFLHRGVCITKAECPAEGGEVEDCPEGMEFTECGSACPATCSNPEPACNYECVRGCVCPAGKLLDQTKKSCTAECEEPPVECKGGKVFHSCGMDCERTCADPHPRCTKEAGTKQCVEKCQCPRDQPVWHEGRCTTEERCPKPEQCTDGKDVFGNGDWWEPKRKPCEKCTCKVDGDEKQEVCSRKECAKRDQCKYGELYEEGGCCPVGCVEACTYNGKVYEIDETWNISPCHTCACHEDADGNKEQKCEFKHCDIPKCDRDTELIWPCNPKEGCCPYCAPQCHYEGHLYAVGESWHPDDCTSCTCTTAMTESCSYRKCPQLPTDCIPVKVHGQCCLECQKPCTRFDKPTGTMTHYEVGNTWHPDPCTECTCHSDQKGLYPALEMSSQNRGNPIKNAFDGDINTMAHSDDAKSDEEQTVTLTYDDSLTITKVIFTMFRWDDWCEKNIKACESTWQRLGGLRVTVSDSSADTVSAGSVDCGTIPEYVVDKYNLVVGTIPDKIVKEVTCPLGTKGDTIIITQTGSDKIIMVAEIEVQIEDNDTDMQEESGGHPYTRWEECMAVDCPDIKCPKWQIPMPLDPSQCCGECLKPCYSYNYNEMTNAMEMKDHEPETDFKLDLVGDDGNTVCHICQCHEQDGIYKNICEEVKRTCDALDCGKGIRPVHVPNKCCPVCPPDFNMCEFKGTWHSIGESWKDGLCTECECKLNGDGKKEKICTSTAEAEACKELASDCNPAYLKYLKTECCPICLEPCTEYDEKSRKLIQYAEGNQWSPDPCTNCDCRSFFDDPDSEDSNKHLATHCTAVPECRKDWEKSSSECVMETPRRVPNGKVIGRTPEGGYVFECDAGYWFAEGSRNVSYYNKAGDHIYPVCEKFHLQTELEGAGPGRFRVLVSTQFMAEKREPEWGLLCDDGWGGREARSVCRMNGYKHGSVVSLPLDPTSPYQYILTGLSCSASRDDDHLFQHCTATRYRQAELKCGRNEVAGVVCYDRLLEFFIEDLEVKETKKRVSVKMKIAAFKYGKAVDLKKSEIYKLEDMISLVVGDSELKPDKFKIKDFDGVAFVKMKAAKPKDLWKDKDHCVQVKIDEHICITIGCD